MQLRVDKGGHCKRFGVSGHVEIREIHDSGMRPSHHRVRRKCLSLMGIYSLKTVLWSSKQSATCQRDWGFLTAQGGVDPRNLGLLPRLMEVFEMLNDLWTRDGILHPPEVELVQHANYGYSENRPGGVWISTPCGVVSHVDGF